MTQRSSFCISVWSELFTDLNRNSTVSGFLFEVVSLAQLLDTYCEPLNPKALVNLLAISNEALCFGSCSPPYSLTLNIVDGIP